MKKSIVMALVGFAFIGASYLLSPEKASAGVNVQVGISVPLPNVVISAPPAVVLIPGTPVYYAPDVGIDIFFYSGHWYRPYEGGWYRATYYNGPWGYLPPARVPAVFTHLPPPGYHNIPPGHQRIPYGQLKKNWKEWDKEQRNHWKHKHYDD